MQKPSNSEIFKKWCNKENEYMSKRLSATKPIVNMNCPESFSFFKLKAKVNNLYNYNFSEEYDKKKQNEYMLNKLKKLYVSPPRRPISNPPNSIQKKMWSEAKDGKLKVIKGSIRKWEILKITQDNQMLQKRLLECKSAFQCKRNTQGILSPKPVSSLGTKKTKIIFSAKNKENISFTINNEKEDIKAKTNEDFFKLKTLPRQKNRQINDSLFLSERKYETERDQSILKTNTNINFADSNAFSVYNKILKDKFRPISYLEKKKTLYRRRAFINKLSLVNIDFMLKDNKFIIKVDPLSVFRSKLFIISFDKVEDILAMKKTYKNYEHIINDLDFDGNNLIINNSKAELVYNTKVISKVKVIRTVTTVEK